MTQRSLFFALCACILLCISPIFAFNPPVAGDAAGTLKSAGLLGANESVTGGVFAPVTPNGLTLNPALAAAEQRIVLDLSYISLIGTNEESGLGHSLNAGILYPTRWAVLSGGISFLTSPFDSLAYGTSGALNASISKELTEKIYLGFGLVGQAGTGWGLHSNLGLVFKTGTLSFLKDTKVGFSLLGMGRPYTATSEEDSVSSMPSMFTPRIGFSARLFKNNFFDIGAFTDISSPTFQNLTFDTGLELAFKDLIFVSSGWNFNLIETLNGAQSYIPSVGISAKIQLDSPKKDSFLAKNGWAQSEITPSISAKPISKDVFAVGLGALMHLGVPDIKPPVIEIEYPESIYISPNNDGIQDELLFPISITDQRFVFAWSFIIENDQGEIIRSIANKEVRTEMQDIKSFWTLLTHVTKEIPLPETLRWDGTMDSGEVAPDGTYYFYITAEDDNENKGRSETYTVYVDNTAPHISIQAPTGTNAMIFSPDGDGNKDTFTISQIGSVEDLWITEISDTNGIVYTSELRNKAPTDFIWDGKTSSGSIAPDGVYAYKIYATDKAGNHSEARIDNIIIDTDKPSINISIDINAFSPNGDGIKDTIQLNPSIPVQNGLIDWNIDITNRNGLTVKTFKGTSVPKTVVFDGTNNTGSLVAEGEYQAIISARYINGYNPNARSPYFTLDITKPEAQARASGSIFSPVGDGKLDTVTFNQQASIEQSWIGEIFALDEQSAPVGKAIRTIQYGSTIEESFTWDGRDEQGKLAQDGFYGYRLQSTDRAGNTGFSQIARVELNTEQADLILQSNYTAFSPNGDGVKDTITFTPIIKATTAVASYTLTISDGNKNIVKTYKGTNKVPASFSWNGIADPLPETTTGERVQDGFYSASLEVTLVNQQSSISTAPEFEIDTKYPEIEVQTPYTVFSPNEDGNKDTLIIQQNSSNEGQWNASIKDSKNTIVKTFTWNGLAENFEWDGCDESGNLLADGTYSYFVFAEDKAGNKTEKTIKNIVLDARKPKAYITAELSAFSPNGDTIKDIQKFSIVTNIPEGLASWSVSIKPEGSQDTIKSWNSSQSETLPSIINWDGKDSNNKIAHGSYYAELAISYTKGDEIKVSTPSFIVNAVAPALNVRLAPKYFSPDNDGIDDELFISLTASSISAFEDWSFEISEPNDAKRIFWKTGGKGKIAERIIWDGRSTKGELVQSATDYPFTFTVTDNVGMTSVVKGYIPVDVLIIKDGDKLKIAVPSIIFRENEADFIGLDADVIDKNTQVLRRIAEILNKFKDYKIQVEGHANNVTGTQKEEDTELIPLSQKRANAVKDFLVQNGVDAARLSTIGMGGTKPVALRDDRENWWKNRRVEFILIK